MSTDPDPRYRYERLRGALVGPQHRQQYATSPRFHDAIDTLVAWLPGWVDSMAALAEEGDAQEAEQLDLIKRTGGTIIVSPEVAANLDPNDELGPPRLTPELLRQMCERFAASHQLDDYRQPDPAEPHRYVVGRLSDMCCPLPYDDPIHIRLVGIHPASGHPYQQGAHGCELCGHVKAKHDEEIHTGLDQPKEVEPHPWEPDPDRPSYCLRGCAGGPFAQVHRVTVDPPTTP